MDLWTDARFRVDVVAYWIALVGDSVRVCSGGKLLHAASAITSAIAFNRSVPESGRNLSIIRTVWIAPRTLKRFAV